MTTLFTIDLTINMPDGDRHAKQLLNFYFVDMPADINEAADKLCGGDSAAQARKFAKLVRKRADVWPSETGGLTIFALLSVSGEDAAFIQQVIAKYMEDFPEYLMKANGRYFPSTSFLPGVSLQPTDWKADVHQAPHTEK